MDVAIFKLLLPGAQLGGIVEKLRHGTVLCAGIAASADLDGFYAPGGEFIDHFVEREVGEGWVENANRNFAFCAFGQGAGAIIRRCAGES